MLREIKINLNNAVVVTVQPGAQYEGMISTYARRTGWSEDRVVKWFKQREVEGSPFSYAMQLYDAFAIFGGDRMPIASTSVADNVPCSTMMEISILS